VRNCARKPGWRNAAKDRLAGAAAAAACGASFKGKLPVPSPACGGGLGRGSLTFEVQQRDFRDSALARRAPSRGLRRSVHVINYADDFVILSRRSAAEALAWTRAVMTKLGLTINETKTSVKDARTEPFKFLGYAFGPHCYQRNGNRYLGASSSEKSIKRVKQRINEVLAPGNVKPWAEVRDQLNAILRGWSAYFCYGTRAKAHKAVDHHVCGRVRYFLSRRHKVPNRGTRRLI
jgi:RNA-directed DNA polymerase